MKLPLCLLLMLVIASPVMASPIINKFDEIAFAEYRYLPPPSVSFIGEYYESKGVNMDYVKMAGVDKFMIDYANKHCYQTLMVEIFGAMMKVYGKPINGGAR